MTWLIALKFLKKYWFVALAVALGTYLYAGWTHKNHKIEALQGALMDCGQEVTLLQQEAGKMKKLIDKQNMALYEMHEQGHEYEKQIEILKARGPEKTIEYREIEKQVVSPECTQALKEAAKVLKEYADAQNK